MSLRFPELVVALLIAYCYAALGNILLRRRVEGWLEWNESFLVGMSVVTTLLFPLSVLLPGRALLASTALLLAAGGWQLWQEVIEGSWRGWPNIRPLARDKLFFFTLTGFFVTQFIVENLRVPCYSDGFNIWASKALTLYHRGGMPRDFMIAGEPNRLCDYPFLVPLYEALLSLFRGSFNPESLKPIFPLFMISMLASTYCAARALGSARLALGVTALVASVPALCTREAVLGFADMPQAMMVAGVVCALLRSSAVPRYSIRHPLGWLIAGLAVVKSEGTVLLVVVVITVAILWLAEGATATLRNLREYRWPAAIILVGATLRKLMLVWLDSHDTTYGPIDHAHILHAMGILGQVPRLCLGYLLNFKNWGILWPGLGLAIVVLVIAGTRIEKGLALSMVFTAGAYTGIFYFTNWPLTMHLATAYDRLMSQVVPLAAVIMVAAYRRLSGQTSMQKRELRKSALLK